MFLGVSILQVPDPVPFVLIVPLLPASHTAKPRISVGGDTKGTRVLETCEQSRNLQLSTTDHALVPFHCYSKVTEAGGESSLISFNFQATIHH